MGGFFYVVVDDSLDLLDRDIIAVLIAAFKISPLAVLLDVRARATWRQRPVDVLAGRAGESLARTDLEALVRLGGLKS